MSELSWDAYDSLKAENERLRARIFALHCAADVRQNMAIEWKAAKDKAEARVAEMRGDLDDAKRYRWLKDNGHLDAWGALKLVEWKIINIDDIIDQEIKEQPK